METVFRLKPNQLNIGLVNAIKALFSDNKELEIIVHSAISTGSDERETREEYWARIDKAIENVENGKNVVRFTGKEFEEFTQKMMNG